MAQQFAAHDVRFGFHLVVDLDAGGGEAEQLDAAVGPGRRAHHEAGLHQAVNGGHHGRVLHADAVGQLRLRQRRGLLGDIGDRQPAGLAQTQVLEAAVQHHAPRAGSAVQRGGKAVMVRVQNIRSQMVWCRTIILAALFCVSQERICDDELGCYLIKFRRLPMMERDATRPEGT